MPTRIPNFLSNAQTPLGQAFANLSSVLMAQPSAADDALQAAQYQGVQQTLQTNADKQTGRTKLGELMTNPDLYKGNMEGSPAVQDGKDPALSTVGVSPIASAFAPKPVDWGAMSKAAIMGDVKPDDLGGYLRFGDANALGVRDPKTTNATVGAGNPYGSTAESFDINQANDLTKAANTNTTSRANNADNINKDVKVEGMQEDAAAARQASLVDPNAVRYDVDYAENHGGQLPPGGRNPAQINADKAALYADMQDKHMNGADLVAQGLGLKARQAAATQAGRTQVSTQINEDTANGAAGILQNLLKKGAAGPTDITGLNDLYVWAKQHTNDPDAANLLNGIGSFSNEYARVLTGATNGTPSSDSARDEAATRILKGYNAGTINDVLGQMHYEMKQRSTSQAHALGDLSGGTYTGVSATPGMGNFDNVPSANAPAAANSGWTVQKVGP